MKWNVADWHVVAHTRDRIGEGPVWIAEDSALYWVDVLGQAINRLSFMDGSLTRWDVPEPIGFLVPRRQHPGFIAGLQSGLHALRLDPFALEHLVDPEPHLPNNRFNDGKADRNGHLWAGTMPMDGEASTGTLYRFDPRLNWQAVDESYRVTNGPAFAPDGRTIYHADSPRRVIYRIDLDDSGVKLGKMPFIHFPESWGFPDGMTMDAEGHLWVAHWDGGRISRFDPEGRLNRQIFLPASRITSCTFAGPALDRLFVTSARDGMEHEPLAGALFEVAPGVTGTPPGVFAG